MREPPLTPEQRAAYDACKSTARTTPNPIVRAHANAALRSFLRRRDTYFIEITPDQSRENRDTATPGENHV